MRLKIKIVRTIYEVEWPENISTVKLAKALGISWMAAHQFIQHKRLPGKYLQTIKDIKRSSVMKDKNDRSRLFKDSRQTKMNEKQPKSKTDPTT